MEKTAGHRSLKERQRQEREHLILQAAEEVLMEKGYYDTSIDEIAARVGIAKGTVYLHFAKKEELVAALFERDIRKLLHVVEEIVRSEQPIRAKLEAILHHIYGGLFSTRMQLLYSIYNNIELRKVFMEKHTSMRMLWDQLFTEIASLIDEGKANGEFDTSIPTSVMSTSFFSLLTPKSYERLRIQEQMSADDLVQYLSRMYFKAIAAL